MSAILRGLLPEVAASRLLALSALLGILIGAAISVLEFITLEVLLELSSGAEIFGITLPLWIIAFLPGLGLALAALSLRTLGKGATPSTSDEYIKAFHQRQPDLDDSLLLPRLLAGVTTVGFGGALGLEGPSIYTGSIFGLKMADRFRSWAGRDGAKLLLTAGAAAGIAAVFQTPATGVVFALEAPYRDDLAHRALLPALIASATSYLTYVTLPLIEAGPILELAEESSVVTGELIGAVIIGIGAGFGGRIYSSFVRRAKMMARQIPPVALVLAAGVLLAALTVLADALFHEPLTMGPGLNAIRWLSSADQSVALLIALFLLRAVATFITVGAGGTGGYFIPLAVQGAIFGRLVGIWMEPLGLSDSFAPLWPILGLAAFLAAGYRTPIAAVIFVAESSGGGPAVVPALIAAAVSQLVAGKASVSVGQRVERLGHLEQRLQMPIAAALTTDVFTVPPDAMVSEFIWIHAIGRRERVVPVVDGNTYLGLCTVAACSAVPREEWETTQVGEVLVTGVPVAQPSWTLGDAVAAMDASDNDTIAVQNSDGSFVGIVKETEIVQLEEILSQAGGGVDPSER